MNTTESFTGSKDPVRPGASIVVPKQKEVAPQRSALLVFAAPLWSMRRTLVDVGASARKVASNIAETQTRYEGVVAS